MKIKKRQGRGTAGRMAGSEKRMMLLTDRHPHFRTFDTFLQSFFLLRESPTACANAKK